MELNFGTGVNSEALISNSSQKIRYKYVLKEKKAIFLPKNEIFAQALLDKSVAMATPQVAVDWKLFQMTPYIIILKVEKFHQSTRNRFGTAEKNL